MVESRFRRMLHFFAFSLTAEAPMSLFDGASSIHEFADDEQSRSALRNKMQSVDYEWINPIAKTIEFEHCDSEIFSDHAKSKNP